MDKDVLITAYKATCYQAEVEGEQPFGIRIGESTEEPDRYLEKTIFGSQEIGPLSLPGTRFLKCLLPRKTTTVINNWNTA